MYTWISQTGRVIEQVRLVRRGDSSRASGRIVSAAHTEHVAFSLEYEAEIGADNALRRVQLTVATEEYERTIDRMLIYTKEGQSVAAELKEHFAMSYYLIRNATLEDVFLRSTGRALVE